MFIVENYPTDGEEPSPSYARTTWHPLLEEAMADVVKRIGNRAVDGPDWVPNMNMVGPEVPLGSRPLGSWYISHRMMSRGGVALWESSPRTIPTLLGAKVLFKAQNGLCHTNRLCVMHTFARSSGSPSLVAGWPRFEGLRQWYRVPDASWLFCYEPETEFKLIESVSAIPVPMSHPGEYTDG